MVPGQKDVAKVEKFSHAFHAIMGVEKMNILHQKGEK